MRPRPTPATNRQFAAVAMFLLTGCIWWTTAPLIKEELGVARTVLGLDSKSSQSFAAGDDVDVAAPMARIEIPNHAPTALGALPIPYGLHKATEIAAD